MFEQFCSVRVIGGLWYRRELEKLRRDFSGFRGLLGDSE